MTITVWKDGTWKCWQGLDADYSTNDPNWLVNIPLGKVLENETIKKFVNLCIPSISPDNMGNLEKLLEQLIKSRHLPTTKNDLINPK